MKKTYNIIAIVLLLINTALQPIINIQRIMAEESNGELITEVVPAESEAVVSTEDIVTDTNEVPELSDDNGIIEEEYTEIPTETPEIIKEEAPIEGEDNLNEVIDDVESDSSEVLEVSNDETDEESVEKEAVTTITLNNGNNVTSDLRTGSTNRFSFNVSNSEATLENAVIRVLVPLTYLETHTSIGQYFPNQGLDSMLSSRVEGNYLIVEYNAENLSETFNTNFTFEFKSLDDGSMPNGSQIPIKSEVVKSGSIVAQTSVVNYQFVTRQPNFSTNVTYPSEASDEDDEEAQRLTEVLFSFSFGDQGVGNGSGRSAVHSVEVKTVVPESLSFEANLNEGWLYDEASRTATYNFTPDASIYEAAYSMPSTLTLVATDNEAAVEASVYADATFNFANGDVITRSNQAEVELAMVATTDMGTMAEVSGNYITGATLVLNPGPNAVTVEDGAIFEIVPEDNDFLQLTYDFEIPDNAEIQAGDTYSIQIPEIIQAGEVSGFEIENEDGILLGSFSISGQTLTITFGDVVDTVDNRVFHLNFQGMFNKALFDENEEVPLEIPLLDGTSYKVTFTPKAVEYEGTDQKTADSQYVIQEGQKVFVDRNPEFIDWTVRVNDSMNSYETATVIDTLGPNLEFVTDNFIVEKIIRNYKNEEIGREVVTGLTPTVTANGFELNIGSIEDAYDITYTTE